MPSVVFDTSVLIPLILETSRSTRIFLRLEIAGWPIVVSPSILNETREKMQSKKSLRKWLKLSDAQIDQFLDVILPGKTRLVAGLTDATSAVLADPKDDMIIAAALESQASYIVSEDKHLLDLKSYHGIKILNRHDFSLELDRLGVPPCEIE